MKISFYFKGIFGLLLMGLLVTACKKEEVQEPEDFQELSFDSEAVLDLLPAGLENSDDFYAQLCVSYVTTGVDMSSFAGSMVVPGDAQNSSGDTWQWSWNYGGESLTYIWSFDEDGSKRSWSMDIQYNGGPLLDYVDAWEYKDGSGGEVLYNFNWATLGEEEPSETLNWKYVWKKNGAGDYTIDWYWESDSQEYTYLTQYSIIVKADGSGSLDTYSEGSKLYHMVWDAQGNGSWVMGDDEDSGSWTAG